MPNPLFRYKISQKLRKDYFCFYTILSTKTRLFLNKNHLMKECVLFFV
ncbi:hypothetical protein HMPREF1145_0704 [Oribacterium parvum ACB8]|nr:hypothetical protein HMPREF1145_0704 [Oribacterium parvum ACB8]